MPKLTAKALILELRDQLAQCEFRTVIARDEHERACMRMACAASLQALMNELGLKRVPKDLRDSLDGMVNRSLEVCRAVVPAPVMPPAPAVPLPEAIPPAVPRLPMFMPAGARIID